MSGAKNGRRALGPSYQWYPTDFAASGKVRRMSWAEQGVYRALLDALWLAGGSIGSDDDSIADALGVDPEEVVELVTRNVRRCFTEADGELRSPRMDREIDSLQEFRQAKAEAGRKGARKRWQAEQEDSERVAPDSSATKCHADSVATDGPLPSPPLPSTPQPNVKRAGAREAPSGATTGEPPGRAGDPPDPPLPAKRDPKPKRAEAAEAAVLEALGAIRADLGREPPAELAAAMRENQAMRLEKGSRPGPRTARSWLAAWRTCSQDPEWLLRTIEAGTASAHDGLFPERYASRGRTSSGPVRHAHECERNEGEVATNVWRITDYAS